MNIEKYCWQQVMLHWFSALVIIWALGSGFTVSLLDVEPSTFERVAQVNSVVGTLFIPVFLLRCYFRIAVRLPQDVNGEGLAALVAHFTHLSLYGLTAVVLLSGILMMDRGIDLGGFTLPAMLSDDFWLSLWFDVHVFSCALLAGLVLLHVVAVIKHELLGRRILQRMWF